MQKFTKSAHWENKHIDFLSAEESTIFVWFAEFLTVSETLNKAM